MEGDVMKKGTINEIVMNVFVLILGVCLLLWADKVTKIVSIGIGAVVIGYAISLFVTYFRNKEKKVVDNFQLVYAITLLVLGGILIFRVDFLKEAVSFIVGIYVLISSVNRLLETIQIGKSLNTKFTSGLILSSIGIFLGIMCIVGKFLLPDIIIKYVGVLLIIYAIISIANLVMIRRTKWEINYG